MPAAKTAKPSDYFVLDCQPAVGSAHYSFEVDSPANGKLWAAGERFVPDQRHARRQPPAEPIEVRVRADTERPPRMYPELTWNPIPLMSRRLVDALRLAGVENLQSFETTLTSLQGAAPPPANHYLAVNLVGLVAAADLEKSRVRKTKTGIDVLALAIDDAKARGHLMFRLAENISAVLVHEQVKSTIESRGITALSWFEPGRWTG